MTFTCHVSYTCVPAACVSGGGVPSTGCGEWSEDSSRPGGLYQQEGGQADRDDCGVRGHTLRGAPTDREKAEGD